MRSLQIILILILIAGLPAVASAKIVFSSQHKGIFSIYVMNDDGSGLTRISSFSERQTAPRWSPDGKQIAFLRDTDPTAYVNLNTFLMDADGRNRRRLTNFKGNDRGLAFSPDGTKLITSRMPHEGVNAFGLMVVDIKTGTEIRISNLEMRDVDWSPNGKQIIFLNDPFRVNEHNLWIVNADGTNPRPWIPLKRNVNRGKPRWSPNGQQILYTEADLHIIEKVNENGGKNISIRPAGTYRYIIRNVDGGGEKILDIPKGWWDHSVAWMDNGEAVLICAFDDVDHIRDPDRSTQLYRYDLATDEITQLTHNLEYKMHVDWISDEVYAVSPTGKYPVRWGELKKAYSNTQ